MSFLPKVTVLVSAMFAVSTFANASSAQNKTDCDLPCLKKVVEACATKHSKVAAWWEFGNGFQSRISIDAPEQCGAAFQRLYGPQGENMQINFEPLEAERSCGVFTSSAMR
jgi:hypothetical protein